MSFLRHKQRAITSRFPHNANRTHIIPNRGNEQPPLPGDWIPIKTIEFVKSDGWTQLSGDAWRFDVPPGGVFNNLRISENTLQIGYRYAITFAVSGMPPPPAEFKFQAGNTGTPPQELIDDTVKELIVDWVIPADATGSTEARWAPQDVTGMSTVVISKIRIWQYFGPDIVLNGDFDMIGPELVTNGSFDERGPEIIGDVGFDDPAYWAAGGTHADWIIEGSQAKFLETVSPTARSLDSGETFNANSYYESTWDVVSNPPNNYRLRDIANAVNGTTKTGVGNVVEVMQLGPVSGDLVTRNLSSVTGGDIVFNSWSAKEVGQGWDWSEDGTYWEDGQAKWDGSQIAVSDLVMDASIGTNGMWYTYSFEVKARTAGNVGLRFGTNATPTETVPGIYTGSIQTTSGSFRARGSSSFEGAIDNVSAKQVGQHWAWPGTSDGWYWEDGQAKADGSQPGVSNLTNDATVTTGETYLISFEIVEITSGQARVNLGNAVSNYYSTVGVHTELVTATNIGAISVVASAGFVGAVDNVIVRRVA